MTITLRPTRLWRCGRCGGEAIVDMAPTADQHEAWDREHTNCEIRDDVCDRPHAPLLARVVALGLPDEGLAIRDTPRGVLVGCPDLPTAGSVALALRVALGSTHEIRLRGLTVNVIPRLTRSD
jgi:hypothetical protein